MADVDAIVEDIVERLRALEEQLRDLAYDALRERAETAGLDGDKNAERRFEQARRAVEKAAHVLTRHEADSPDS